MQLLMVTSNAYSAEGAEGAGGEVISRQGNLANTSPTFKVNTRSDKSCCQQHPGKSQQRVPCEIPTLSSNCPSQAEPQER